MKGILGRKIGMTEVFTTDGKLIPVTVIEVTPNIVTAIKTKEKDGYEAIQLAFSEKREKLTNKPEMGQFKKANTTPKRFLKEFRGVDVNAYTLGMEVDASIFTEGEMVDVTGKSKGKGFQGVIKRHNQSRGPMGHGSQYHRGVGSMGTMLPMRVLPGKKLPGHMGNVQVTVQNLQIIKIDLENNVILVKGNVPGPKKSLVIIKQAVKKADTVKKDFELISYKVETPEEVSEEIVEETVEVVEETVTENNETEESTEETVEETAQASEKVVSEETNENEVQTEETTETENTKEEESSQE